MKCWEIFLKNLESDIGKETVDNWLRTLRIVRFDAANLYLEASDSFQALWFQEHIAKRAKSTLQANGRPIRVHLSVKGKAPKTKRAKKSVPAPPSYASDPWDKTFTEWMLEEGNRLALKVLQNIDVDQFNPYFLFGKAGSGKTHLLMAAASKMAKKGLKVHYVRAETFTAHVVRAIRTGDMDAFRKAYREIDALFLDDVEVLAGKAATQEEFFHTFNTLHSAGKPIVLSAQSPPRAIDGIEDRLVSRFEWGISCPIAPITDLATLLQKRLEPVSFKMHPSAYVFLREELKTATGIGKAVETLIYHSHLRKKEAYDRKDIENIVRHVVAEERKRAMTPEKIVGIVAEHFTKNADEVRGRGQTKDLVLPRQITMYFLRKELALSYAKIGTFMGRDHSTVMTSVKQVEEHLSRRDDLVSPAIHAIGQILR